MECQSCQFVNDEGSRFCESCGSALERVCAHCGGQSKASARFCRQCGHAFDASTPGEACDKIGSTVARTGAHGVLGEALALGDELEAARQSLEFAVELGREEQVDRYYEPQFLATLAEVQLALGDGPRALELAQEAVEVASRTEQRVGEIRARLAYARFLLAESGASACREVESVLDRAEALVRTTGARAYEPQIIVERAHVERTARLLAEASK